VRAENSTAEKDMSISFALYETSTSIIYDIVWGEYSKINKDPLNRVQECVGRNAGLRFARVWQRLSYCLVQI